MCRRKVNKTGKFDAENNYILDLNADWRAIGAGRTLIGWIP